MNDINLYTNAFLGLLPEFVIVLAILISSVWNLFVPKLKFLTPWFGLLATFVSSMMLAFQLNIGTVSLFNGVFTIDKLTVIFGIFINIIGFIVILMTMGYEQHLKDNAGEFYTILLTAIVSVMLLAGSSELVLLFVALETLSIACVILAGFEKQDVKSQEACLKYLISTAAVTSTLLYGFSFIYGLTGSTMFSVIQEQFVTLNMAPHSLISVLILVLLISAVGFKLSIVPFHMWTPDVFEGAPTPVTAFLSIGSKLGAFAIALRLLVVVFGKAIFYWTLILSILAVLSMVVGNLIALSQKSFKRMLAYSSIAHIGYMLIGIVEGSSVGVSAAMFYLIVYGFMNLGAFAAAILFTNETNSDNIDDYAGLIRKRPILALGLSLCLINLAGLPIPPAGFLAKFFVFSAGFNMGTIPIFFNYSAHIGSFLVVIALLTSIPAIYYYTRVVIKMLVSEPSDVVKALPDKRQSQMVSQTGPITALGFCIVMLCLIGTNLVDLTMNISQTSIKPLYVSHESRSPNSEF